MGEGALDKKMLFGVKDIVYIVLIVASVLGNYYATDTRLILVERDVDSNTKKLEKYDGLPQKVARIEITVNENATITRSIYLGLVAKGIIKPK